MDTTLDIPEIGCTTRAGVPIFVADDPGPARAALVFGVGRRDETLPTAGITHLVEHLAMFGLGETKLDCNAFVEATRTVLWAQGSPEDCSRFVAEVTTSLSRLDAGRVELERRVLDTEASRRANGVVGEALVYRYGPNGPGLLGYSELGLRWLTAEHVDAWRRRWFHSGNVALWCNGLGPDDFEIHLPAGSPEADRRTEPVEDDLPAWYPSVSPQGVALSFVGPREAALTAGLRILQRRLHRRLRVQLAIAYAVEPAVFAIDRDSMHATLVCDSLPEHVDQASAVMAEELSRLVDDGPDPADLADEQDAWRRSWSQPGALLGVADDFAHDHVLGAPRRTVADRVASRQALTTGSVAEALAGSASRVLWGVPTGGTPPECRPAAQWSATSLEGRALEPSATWQGSADDRLVISPDGITFRCQDGAVTVRFDRCAAALTSTDGRRLLYGEDGFVLKVVPSEWVGGDAATSLVDEHVPAERLVPIAEPQGADAAAPQPQPQTPPRRRLKIDVSFWRRVAVVVWALVSVALVFAPFTRVVPAGTSGEEPCGTRSALMTVVAGVDERIAGDAGRARACRDEARTIVVLGALGAASAAGVVVVVVRWRRRWRADQPA